MALTFLQAAINSTSSLSTYTFASQNIGTAASDRVVIVLVKISATSGTISNVTIQGITSTLIQYQGGAVGSCSVGIAIASVPTGTTGDVVVNFSSSLTGECGIGVYTANSINLTAYNSAATGFGIAPTDPTLTVSVNIPATGFTIGIAATQNDAAVTGFTWTGLTKDYEGVVRSNAWHSGASGTPTAQTGYSVSVVIASTTTLNVALLVASFQSNASTTVPMLATLGIGS